jgi:protein tyrosine phosphatase (PTP) superfamily phosphohydrolase (DUF442 family)
VHHKKFLFSVIIAIAALAIAITTIVFGSGSGTESRSVDAKDRSEQPLEDSSGEVAATLPLFHRVDENYARGSQPARGGISTLKRLGVKTIVDLRSPYDYSEEVKAAAEVSGLNYQRVPMSVWNPPTDDEAQKFVSIVSDATNGPFFVFCADGLNRTGEMTAIYRVARDNWTVEKALDEADELGFSPYYYTLRDYVWDYARKFRPSAVPPTGRRVSSTEP